MVLEPEISLQFRNVGLVGAYSLKRLLLIHRYKCHHLVLSVVRHRVCLALKSPTTTGGPLARLWILGDTD